jgi:hypothetical protein
MAVDQAVICETPGVTVSSTTEEERKASGNQAPEAELEGALKVIRALGERVTERLNQTLPQMQMLERRMLSACEQGHAVDTQMCSMLQGMRQLTEEIAEELRKFQQVETICIRETPIGDILALEESIQPELAGP